MRTPAPMRDSAARWLSGLRLRRPGRLLTRAITFILASIVIVSAAGQTISYLTSTQGVGSNTLASAKAFSIADVSATAESGGAIVINWSAASWATGGYSVRRNLTGIAPFVQIGTTTASTLTYTDSTGTDATTYYYVVDGISANGGNGLDSAIVSAVVSSSAPTITSTVPAKAAIGVVKSLGVSVTFSKAMNQLQTAAAFSLVICTDNTATCIAPGAAQAGVVTWQSTSQLLFSNNVVLASNQYYAILVTGGSGGAVDLAGNAVSLGAVCSRTVGNSCLIAFQTSASAAANNGVTNAVPANGATGIGTNTKIFITFSGATIVIPIQKSAMQSAFSTSPVTVGTFAWSGTTMTYTPSSNLTANTAYTFTVNGSGTGPPGNNWSINYSATFTTGAGTDVTAPTVSSVTTAAGATGVLLSPTITINFSKSMNPLTTVAAITLTPDGATCAALGSAAAITGSWSSPTSYVLVPTVTLTASTCYQIAVSATATDAAGNALTSFTSTFTTAPFATVPTIAYTNGTLYYPTGSVAFTGSNWADGSSTVAANWSDGTTLGTYAVAAGNIFGSLTIPATATGGDYLVKFSRTGGETIYQTLTIQSVKISLTANPSDIAAGGSTTLTAFVSNGGNPLSGLTVTFTKVDPGARGTFTSLTAITNASGLATTTLSTSAGGVFANITVTAAIG